jgi:hypothetical protein
MDGRRVANAASTRLRSRAGDETAPGRIAPSERHRHPCSSTAPLLKLDLGAIGDMRRLPEGRPAAPSPPQVAHRISNNACMQAKLVMMITGASCWGLSR